MSAVVGSASVVEVAHMKVVACKIGVVRRADSVAQAMQSFGTCHVQHDGMICENNAP